MCRRTANDLRAAMQLWISISLLLGLNPVRAAPQQASPSQRAHARAYGDGFSGPQRPGQKTLEQEPTTREIHDESLMVVGFDTPSSSTDQLSKSACEADAVVAGRAVSATSYLSEDSQFIFTDYELAIEKVIRGSGLQVGTTVIYTRPGGKLRISGRPVVATHSRYPEIRDGQEYVFFLQRLSDGAYKAASRTRWSLDALEIRGESVRATGPQGLFDLKSGASRQNVESALALAKCSAGK
jgi:hypothetical protein